MKLRSDLLYEEGKRQKGKRGENGEEERKREGNLNFVVSKLDHLGSWKGTETIPQLFECD